MRVLVATADHPYFLWQVLVQVQHFRELECLDEVDWLVYHQGSKPSPLAQRLALETGARLNFWRDVRPTKGYNAAMKPWLLGAFFRKFPEAVDEPFQYLDPDVLLTQPPDFYDEIPSWSGSITDSYTGPSYLRSHGEDLWVDLCELAGVDPDHAAKVQGAGAQWVIQDADAKFWFDLSALSHAVWRRCQRQPKVEGQQFTVQAWCAEMYATQLLALAYGFPVRPDPAMSFLWANGAVGDWDKHAYFHDAGVSEPNGRDFCKITYQSSPFHQDIAVDPSSASSRYVELIKRTEEAFRSLVW